MRAAQDELHGYACELRGAIEHGWPPELIALDTPTHRIWVMGGPSSGPWPGQLVEPTVYLAEAGITDAAGFDGYTRYEGPPIERRTFEFDRDELRLVRFGVTAAHAAEQAAEMEHPAPGARAREWLEAWLDELDGVADPDIGARALLRFAARGLALSAWLKRPEEPLSADRLDEHARELAQMADDDDLYGRPRRRSLSAAARECRRLAEVLGGWFDVLDDPTHQDDEDVQAFVAFVGGTLADAVQFELGVHPLCAAIAALADLCGDEAAALVDTSAGRISLNSSV